MSIHHPLALLTEFEKAIQQHAFKIQTEPTAKEYWGTTVIVQKEVYRFRKAKSTPKKVGFFVTLWTRDTQNQSIPFSDTDAVDFVFIHVQEENQAGWFIFPKSALLKHGILQSSNHPGKRGFRLYPSWITPEIKQAKASQMWQNDYFFDYTKTSVSEALIARNVFDFLEEMQKEKKEKK